MIRLTNSARALLAVLSIFVMGLAVGCTLDRTILAPSANAVAAGVRSDPTRHHAEVLAELKARLGLAAEQAVAVEKIFEARQGEMEERWAEVHAKLQDTMQRTTTEIEAVLDSEQIAGFHAWLAERHGSADHMPGRTHGGSHR